MNISNYNSDSIGNNKNILFTKDKDEFLNNDFIIDNDDIYYKYSDDISEST